MLGGQGCCLVPMGNPRASSSLCALPLGGEGEEAGCEAKPPPGLEAKPRPSCGQLGVPTCLAVPAALPSQQLASCHSQLGFGGARGRGDTAYDPSCHGADAEPAPSRMARC